MTGSEPLARIDLDGDQWQVLMCMTAGACSLLVDMDRKSTGSVGRKDELGDGAGSDAFFDVITVKMQEKGLVARPSQFHDIALVDANEPHRIGDAAALDRDVKSKLCRGNADAIGDDQQLRQRQFTPPKG